MSKKPFDMKAMPGQQSAVDATRAAGRVAIESAQAIAQINQQATQLKRYFLRASHDSC